MKPRTIVVVVLLVAVPVAAALLVANRREGAESDVATASQVSLELKGGVGNAALAGCGTTHHFTEYKSHGSISFDGAVVNPPRGSWKVKVKLKSCIGGHFEGAGEIHVHRHNSGRYRGSFTAPVPGLYFVRAQVSSGKVRVARSDKQFFRVR